MIARCPSPNSANRLGSGGRLGELFGVVLDVAAQLAAAIIAHQQVTTPAWVCAWSVNCPDGSFSVDPISAVSVSASASSASIAGG